MTALMTAAAARDMSAWSARIRQAWRSSLAGIIDAGQLLIDAKAALPHGQFGHMLASELPFSGSTARRLMAIARDRRIVERAHVHDLPPHWGTLYELTKLDDETFDRRLADGSIYAEMERGEVEPAGENLRAAIGTDSASASDRGDNFYRTPIEAVRALLAVEPLPRRIIEPACGDGAIATPLAAAGHDVECADLVDRGYATADGVVQAVGDFLQSRRDPAEDGEFAIVTNPPYGAALNGFAAHALREHRPAKLALLLNLNALCGTGDADRNFWLDDRPPARVLVMSRRLPMMHRDGWTGPLASSRMNTAWFIWRRAVPYDDVDKAPHPYGAMTELVRIDWKNASGENANVS